MGDFNLGNIKWTYNHSLRSLIPNPGSNIIEIAFNDALAFNDLYQYNFISNTNKPKTLSILIADKPLVNGDIYHPHLVIKLKLFLVPSLKQLPTSFKYNFRKSCFVAINTDLNKIDCLECRGLKEREGGNWE